MQAPSLTFAAGIAIMEEIKRFHRARLQDGLPDRYTALRKILIAVRAGRIGQTSLSEEQRSFIQTALVNLADAEHLVERN